jgi:hypothetical protein
MTHGRRHVLVIASQCDEKPKLDRLDEAAGALHTALRDGDIGGCEPGLPDGESLLRGSLELEAATIAVRIREAIGYAGDTGSTLVLALLGHGFIPGGNPALYLMGKDSKEGFKETAVDVRALLGEAADRPGIKSVIALIDTCTAAGAIPLIGDITTGTRNGKIRLWLLMAAAVEQPAFDMGMSRELAAVLRAGAPGVGALLRLSDVAPIIQAALAGQDLRKFDYDGDVSAEPMWLARNRHARGNTLAIGAHRDKALAAALRPLGDRPLPVGFEELRELHAELSARLRQGDGSLDLIRAAGVVDSLIAAHRTAVFLQECLAGALRTASLRRALVVAGGTLDGDPAAVLASEVDAAELAALTYPSVRERDCRPQLARFVVALAHGAGIDPGGAEFKQWAEHSVGRRFRLIVSYDSLAGEWPEKVRAWVVYAGRECGKNSFDCTADQPGAEDALAEAVSWAEEQAARLGEDLDRIEVAVPARMLVDWHPEQVEYNGSWLGVNYTVLPRWSQRLEPTAKMRGYNSNVRKRLAELSQAPEAGLPHWLGAPEVGDSQALRQKLAMGGYAPASGLIDRPDQDGSLVDLLLRYLPVVLWPQAASLGSGHCERVASRWNRLPDDFLAAYRARWAGKNQQDPDLIADIRAVWDDEDWLRFCGTAST